MDADSFTERAFQIAVDMKLRVEERRPGKSICFNEKSKKWLSEHHLRALHPAVLEHGVTDAQINQMVHGVAPGRPCTHKGFRSIVAKIKSEHF